MAAPFPPVNQNCLCLKQGLETLQLKQLADSPRSTLKCLIGFWITSKQGGWGCIHRFITFDDKLKDLTRSTFAWKKKTAPLYPLVFCWTGDQIWDMLLFEMPFSETDVPQSVKYSRESTLSSHIPLIWGYVIILHLTHTIISDTVCEKWSLTSAVPNTRVQLTNQIRKVAASLSLHPYQTGSAVTQLFFSFFYRCRSSDSLAHEWVEPERALRLWGCALQLNQPRRLANCSSIVSRCCWHGDAPVTGPWQGSGPGPTEENNAEEKRSDRGLLPSPLHRPTLPPSALLHPVAHGSFAVVAQCDYLCLCSCRNSFSTAAGCPGCRTFLPVYFWWVGGGGNTLLQRIHERLGVTKLGGLVCVAFCYVCVSLR